MHTRHPHQQSFRPRLEALEPRTLPSVFTVDRLTDAGAGSGLTGDLRYCLSQAQNGDRIAFDAAVRGTINLTGPLPDLTRSVSIEGPGADQLTVRRDTGGDYRILRVTGGASVALSGLTISNGRLTSTGGSGIDVFQASLTADGIVLSGNTNTDPVNGGALLTDTATVTIRNSAIVNNTSAGVGAGIYNFFSSTLTLVNTTISGNTVTGSAFGQGGGIWTYAALTLQNCTVANNSASQGGGGIAVRSFASVSMQDTILAGNTSAAFGDPDLSGPLAASGYNLIGNTQGGSGFAATDRLNVDPRLGPLQNNGGPTPTMALLPGSPALDAGTAAGVPATDQRGLPRSGGVNIGAYQASAFYFDVSGPDQVIAGAPFDVAVTARDEYGHLAAGYVGTVYLNSTDPQNVYMDGHTFTLSDGGTFAFTGEQLFSAPQQLLYALDGSIGGTGPVVAVQPATPTQLYLVVPDSAYGGVSAGSPLSVTAYLYDAYGNLATNFTGTLHLASSDGAATLPDDYPFTAADAGSHAFTLTLNTPGPVSVTASVVGSPGVSFELDLFVL